MKNEYPTILERVKSSLIDSIVIVSCFFLATEILNIFNDVPDWIRATLFILIMLYEPVMVCFGGTLGNNKIEIRVRKNSNPSQKINFFQSLVRYFFKVMLGWISLILIMMNSKGRAVHDIVSGSVMIKTEK